VRRPGSAKVAAVTAVLGPAFVAYGSLWLRTLLARQSGLDPGPALEQAVGAVGRIWPALLMIGIGAGLGSYLLAPPGARARQQVAPQAARTAGAQWWRRYQVLMTVLILITLVLMVLAILLRAVGRQSLRPQDWESLWYVVFFVIWLPVYWLVKPSRETLYALGSGDRSQVNDERVQEVKGRAAGSAIGAFVALVLLVGMPYEVLVRGVWPIRSFAEAAAILFLWSIFAWRWNRKL